jgi:hypothetical protein
VPRRNLPQFRIDDRAFPIRAIFRVPDNGFGVLMSPLQDWLDRHCTRAGYAWHPGSSLGKVDSVAIYFRDPDHLAAFHAAWPMLELADSTILPSYRSPAVPR